MSVFRHGGDVGFDAVVDLPVLAFVPEQPRHFEPFGLGVGGFERFIDLTAHTAQIFGFPARRNEFVEDVDAIDVVGAVELRLLGDELLLNFGVKRVKRVEELAPADAVEACPVAQRSQRCVWIKPCDARWYMACETR